jgi:nitrite reductase/ring-hydroxylating ferredoxin subunit
MPPGSRITSVESVPDDGSFLFTVRDESGSEREAILVRLADDTVTAWFNQCQHFTHIALDKGSGAPRRNGELVCANHGAMFDAATGECTYGPCEGAVLPEVSVSVADGDVFLADDDLTFVATGGRESDPADLTSTSNVEF